MTDLELHRVLLRNRIPQNIHDEASVREVAKDIVENDITNYGELNELVQKGIKYLLFAGLTELSFVDPVSNRTLAWLFEWARPQKLAHSQQASDKYFDMLSLMPKDELNLARFYVCDKLMKYSVCAKVNLEHTA